MAEDDLRGTCKLLQAYLEMPEETCRAMRQRARKCFERRFEITKAAESLEKVLASVSKAS